MKRVLFSITLLVALSNILSAQMNTTEKFRFKRIEENNYNRINQKSDIQGTPYLDKEFIQGTIINGDGAVLPDLRLRYDVYDDELEFLKGEEFFVIDPKTTVKRAEFGGKVFSYLQYETAGKIQSGFFEILTEGKATLLGRYLVRFFEKEEAQAYVDAKPARFDAPVKAYYISINSSVAQSVTNKKSLLKLFGDKKGEMETYISKSRLSVTEDESLKKIIAYYNSL
jgi:hypothetical protein